MVLKIDNDNLMPVDTVFVILFQTKETLVQFDGFVIASTQTG